MYCEQCIAQFHSRKSRKIIVAIGPAKQTKRKSGEYGMTLVLAVQKVRKVSEIHSSQTFNMRSIARSTQPFFAAISPLKHTSRVRAFNATPAPSWNRSFHASANLRVVDLAYRLHDDSGKAKGDPIVIIHGLFGSKRNNQSVGKYAPATRHFFPACRLTYFIQCIRAHPQTTRLRHRYQKPWRLTPR